MSRALTAVPDAETPRASWEQLLLVSVRPEFRGEVIVATTGSPLLGAGCAVTGCTGYGHYRPWGHGTGRALCALHGGRWLKDGRPEIDGWVQRAGPLRALRPVRVCSVPGCRRSAKSWGRCGAHRWRRDGPSEVGDEVCRVDCCEFPTVPRRSLCDIHQDRYRARNDIRARKGIEPASLESYLGFVRVERERAAGAYVVRSVSGLLRLELQYLLQHEADVGRQVNPRRFNDLVALLSNHPAPSLLSRSADEWRKVADAAARRYAALGALVAYAHERLCELRDGAVDPWAPDRWRMARLPLSADYAHDKTKLLDFAAIRRGWLRELLKRWARYRLQSGTMAPQGVSHALWSFKELERFCELSGIELTDADQLSRRLLEDFLDHVARRPLAKNTKHALLRHVKVVLDDVDRHGWVRLQRDARYFPDELPSQRHSLPRFVEETVMRQLESDPALERIGEETTITAVVVLIETGLRSQDALLLEADPVVLLADSSPVLRFINHKRRREAAIPISDRLLARIRYQQTRNAQVFPHGSPWLLPAIGGRNGQGQRPYHYATLLARLTKWLAGLELVDAQGAPVTVTPHQFRHTLGTRMINEDIPLEVIRRMLDHGSLSMTQVYARLSDNKLREHFDTFHERINRRGEKLTLQREGVLGEATWTKERLARARQALPNGYCGLPLQQQCPHPNACLSCDSFLTDVNFLDVHREHLVRVEQQLEQARGSGWERIAESNESDRINLINIIEGLERLGAENARQDDAA
ncbi:MAG: tyrosine-type recombinase/integrase [Solirubrobacteraceae bacterium]